MGDDRGYLPAGESDILARQLVHGPGAGIQGVVEGVLPAVAPVPALQRGRPLHGQHLLVNRLSSAAQTHGELQKERKAFHCADRKDLPSSFKDTFGNKPELLQNNNSVFFARYDLRNSMTRFFSSLGCIFFLQNICTSKPGASLNQCKSNTCLSSTSASSLAKRLM